MQFRKTPFIMIVKWRKVGVSGEEWRISTLSTEFSTGFHICPPNPFAAHPRPPATDGTERQETRMLYGRYQHNIDAKGRIFVPAKLREKLGDQFIAAAVMDHCVSLYSMEEWDKLQQGLADMPFTKARKLQRYLSSNAADVQVDAQGRILLPKHLLAYAALEKEALVIGAGNRAEIWNPVSYEEDSGAMTPEEVEAEFMELGF